MAVKDAILAILTLGSAYGLQLRDEIVVRAPHREGVNVGQVYSTLDRLVKAGLISSDAATDDNLPLYALTPKGRTAALEWLAAPTIPDVRNWPDMADQVLVASSLPGFGWRSVLTAQVASWESARADAVARDREDATGSVQSPLARLAEQQIARAALEWLSDAEARLSASDPGVPLRSIRPQRGRRPGPVLDRESWG